MSGKTAFQKIVEKNCIKVLPDGSMVLKLDRVWCHEITTPNAILDAKERKCDEVFDSSCVKAMIDHVSPAKDTDSAIQGQILRGWCKEHDVEFLDVGNNGVCHAIIPEKGWVRPGEIGIMGDSHTCTHGAFGAFAAGVGTTELEAGIITGIWICPPQKVIRVNFVGTLPANVYSKDLILTLIKKIGVKGATNAVLEFGGSVIDKMTMEARMTITNMAVEAGATSGMMNVDDTTMNYLGKGYKRWIDKCLSSYGRYDIGGKYFNSDPNAVYDQVIEIDVTGMVPVTTEKYSLADVVLVSDLVGEPVDQVYIGSCTNGRSEDLRTAAQVFRSTGRKVAKGVRCVVVPATQHIWDLAMEDGTFKTLREAGCHISGPSCGACLGMSCGVLAPGEVCVSTTNRNFTKRMGKGGMVHLASPATAAITAIKGVVSVPDLKLCEDVNWEVGKMPAQEPICFTDWDGVPSSRPDYTGLATLFNDGEVKDFSGKVFYLPAINVNTDQIIPADYLNKVVKEEFGQHCLEGAELSQEDRTKFFGSQILVAGENFGCGSSREHAPWAFQGMGVRCIIAPSFARIFETGTFANGMLAITLPKEDIERLMDERPESLYVDWELGAIGWEGEKGIQCEFELTGHQENLIRSGGLVGVMVKLAAELQKEGKL